MSASLVELDHVNRSFGGGLRWKSLARLKVRYQARRQVLKDVSFTLGAGEWLAIMGTNGSGKTTILKMIAGLVRAEDGRVLVEGMDVRTHGSAARRVVGYSLADERSFQWRLTARENLRFFASLEGLSGVERTRRVNELLSAMDLDAQAERPFGEFSTGIRQRLAIARALLRRPRVLLLDEPTRSLDTSHATEVWRVIREEMDDNGGSVIVATHRSEEAAEYCQQLRVLKEGVLREQSNHRMHRSGGAELGYAIMVRGLSPVGTEVLRAREGVRSIEVATIAAGESILDVRMEHDASAAGMLIEVLSRHGGTIEAVHEQVLPAREPRSPLTRTTEAAR